MISARSDPAQTAATSPFDLIPDEVIEHHILTNISFNNWIKRLSRVCKRWFEICSNASVAPRQLYYFAEGLVDLDEVINAVSTWRPTFLFLDIDGHLAELNGLHAIVTASDRLDTLLLTKCIHDDRSEALEQITTLCLSGSKSELKVAKIFHMCPNLKRLQVDRLKMRDDDEDEELEDWANEDYADQVEKLNQLDELALMNFKDKQLNDVPANMTVPIITIVYTELHKVVKRINGVTKVYNEDDLSYEEYLQLFGRTKLCNMLDEKKFEEAARLLDTQTIEYDRCLLDKFTRNHHFPSQTDYTRFFEYDHMLLDKGVCSEAAWKLLVEPKKVPMEYDHLKISVLLQHDRFEEAWTIFRDWTMDIEDYTNEQLLNPSWMLNSLLELVNTSYVTIEHVKQPEVESKARLLMRRKEEPLKFKTVAQFNKISFLRSDWSGVEAEYDHGTELFWTMVRHGCKIPWFQVVRGPSVFAVVDRLIDEGFTSPLEAAFNFQACDVLQFIKKYKITPEQEMHGRSLLNHWIRTVHPDHCDLIEEMISEYRHLINRVDSEGNSPLIASLQTFAYYAIAPIMLKYGADPTRHHGGSLSPIAMVITHSNGRVEHKIAMIKLLVQHGASVHAPCLYNKRMCSPLMIAVDCYYDNTDFEVVKMLVVELGAAIDYKDELGRSVKDYVGDSELLRRFTEISK